MSQPCPVGCQHLGFTHEEFVTHLFEKCPCTHTRIQHPGGDCRYCECPLFGIHPDEAARFVQFLTWKAAGSLGHPPGSSLPRQDLVPPLNPCPPCVREAAFRRAFGGPRA